jgi:hypothetical protein
LLGSVPSLVVSSLWLEIRAQRRRCQLGRPRSAGYLTFSTGVGCYLGSSVKENQCRWLGRCLKPKVTTMSLKDAYREKMEARIAEQQARLDLLKARAKMTAADGKIMAYEELADAKQKLAAAKVKLKEMAHASEGAYRELKTDMEKAWDALITAGREAARKYK